MRRGRFRLAWPILAVGAMLVQLVGLYRATAPPEGPGPWGVDKIAHLVIFGAPVLLILISLSVIRGEVGRVGVVVVTAIFVAHAIISELIQAFFYTHRRGDPRDVAADCVGIALALIAWWIIGRGRHRHIHADAQAGADDRT